MCIGLPKKTLDTLLDSLPETSVISNFFSVKIFKIRFLSVFQEFFTEISLGAVVFFVSIGSMFQEYIS